MKKKVLNIGMTLFLFIGLHVNGFAQAEDCKGFYFVPEEMPEYRQGNDILEEKIIEKLQTYEFKESQEKSVVFIMEFRIDCHGTPYMIDISKSPDESFTTWMEEVLKEEDAWVPGRHNGRPTNSAFNIYAKWKRKDKFKVYFNNM